MLLYTRNISLHFIILRQSDDNTSSKFTGMLFQPQEARRMIAVQSSDGLVDILVS